MNARTQVKNELKKVFDSGRVEAMDIFKGFATDTNKTGWHYRDFGYSNYNFMGKSITEVKEYIEDLQ